MSTKNMGKVKGIVLMSVDLSGCHPEYQFPTSKKSDQQVNGAQEGMLRNILWMDKILHQLVTDVHNGITDVGKCETLGKQLVNSW